MNVLVTGGTGYLGGHLVRAMAGIGWSVTVLARASSESHSLADVLDRVKLVRANEVEVAFRDIGAIDLVVHTATCYGRNGEPASELFAANVVFPLQVVGHASEHGAKLFCNTDTMLDRDVNPYCLTKKQFLERLQLQSEEGTIRVANIVLDQFYGPGNSHKTFVTWLVRQCLNNDVVPLTVGTQKRRFLYIDDLVSGYMAAIQGALWQTASFLEFHLASREQFSIREVAEMVRSLTGSRAELRFGAVPLRVHEPKESCMDPTTIRALNWQEQVSLEEGLTTVIHYERGVRQ